LPAGSGAPGGRYGGTARTNHFRISSAGPDCRVLQYDPFCGFAMISPRRRFKYIEKKIFIDATARPSLVFLSDRRRLRS
jgi:hypothetical protein